MISVIPSATDYLKILGGYKVTSGRRMVVNSGRMIVHIIPCFGNSYMLSRVELIISQYS